MDLKKCLKVHGYIPNDNESDNGYDTFDELYNKHKPVPVPYNKFKHRIVNIHASTGAKDSSSVPTRHYAQPTPDATSYVEHGFQRQTDANDDFVQKWINEAQYNAASSLSATASRQQHGQIGTVTPQLQQAHSCRPQLEQAAAKAPVLENVKKYHVPEVPVEIVRQPSGRQVHRHPGPASVNTTSSLPKRKRNKRSITEQPVQTISGNMPLQASNSSNSYHLLKNSPTERRLSSPNNRSKRQQQQQQQQQLQRDDDDVEGICCTSCCVS